MTKQAAHELRIEMARDYIAKQAAAEGVDIDEMAAGMTQDEVGDLLIAGMQDLQESGAFDDIVVDEVDENDMLDVEALMKLAETDPAQYVELSQNEEFLGRLSATVAMQKVASLSARRTYGIVKQAAKHRVKERTAWEGAKKGLAVGAGSTAGGIVGGLVGLNAVSKAEMRALARRVAARANPLHLPPAVLLGSLAGQVGGGYLARHLTKEKGEPIRHEATLAASLLPTVFLPGVTSGVVGALGYRKRRGD